MAKKYLVLFFISFSLVMQAMDRTRKDVINIYHNSSDRQITAIFTHSSECGVSTVIKMVKDTEKGTISNPILEIFNSLKKDRFINSQIAVLIKSDRYFLITNMLRESINKYEQVLSQLDL